MSGKKLLDDYKILETLGKGTFGKVKLAIHKPTKQEVAIKIFEKKNLISSKDIIYFQKEISILKLLNHPNIINIYNIIEDDSNIYIIMEYASKGELFKYIVNKKRLEEKEAANFYCQLIYGLEYIHKNKISHRDLKPENLLIKDDNILAIIDFGLSSEYKNNELLSTPCGSPSYAAPEMILGKRYNGMNIDIWSSGITLYAMVCGRLPFKDKNQEKLYKKILTYNYQFPSFLSDNCKDLIQKILCDEKIRINIEEIKKHPFLIDSFNKYNPNEHIFYNQNKIYNTIIEKMVNNMPEYHYNKDEIIFSVKNKKFNNITTTYKLLMKKILSKENKNKTNYLNTKSSTDSCVTTNNVSNLLNKCSSLDERKKFNNKKFEKKQKNNDSKKEINIINNKNYNSFNLSMQTKNDFEQNKNDNNIIYSYFTQNNPQKKIIKKENSNKINQKYKIDLNKIYIKKKDKKLEFDNYSFFNSNSSREITNFKKDLNNNIDENTNTFKTYNIFQKNLKQNSADLDNICHNQNIYSNDICNYNISEISTLEKDNKNKHLKNKEFSINILNQRKKKIKKNDKKINNLIVDSGKNKNELNQSKTYVNHLRKTRKQKIITETKETNKLNINQDYLTLNNNRISLPETKTKGKCLKISNFKENKFFNQISPNPPSTYLKVNNSKNKNSYLQQKPLQNNFEMNSKRDKSKSIHKKLFSNNSNKKINIGNIFIKKDDIKINNQIKINKNETKNKLNTKKCNAICKQKLKVNANNIKIGNNYSKKNSNNFACNPFNQFINNNINVKASNLFSNNTININNISINSNNKNSPKNYSMRLTEKLLDKTKTLSNKSLNYLYNSIDQKINDKSLSNKNIIKFNSDEVVYYKSILKRKNNNNPINSQNNSYFNDNYSTHNKYRKSKDKDRYSRNTYDSNSKDFAVCNTNSSLEEIYEKLIELSKIKGFSLNKIDLRNYICTNNKNNSIKIEISSKGRFNMLKIYYLEGKEKITKEMIKNIIFSIGF